MNFTDFARDISQRLAAAGRREPPAVLHSAVQLVLGAQLGEEAPQAKMQELGRRSPGLRELFEHAHHLLATHPLASHFGWPQLSTGRGSGGGHGGHGHHGHDRHAHRAEVENEAVFEDPWWRWASPGLEYVVLKPPSDEDEERELEESPLIPQTTGRGGVGTVVVLHERAIGEPLGAPLNAAWAGVEGYGRHYVTAEQRRMDRVRPFGDGEPDWPVHWSQRS